MNPLSELRLGPVKSERDQQIALDDIQRKLNEIIRAINTIMERAGYVES